jgi:hypothetical protein
MAKTPEQRIAELEALVERLKSALLAVETWSFKEVIDLTPAGYEWWSQLLHGPRKPKTREQMLAILDEIEARRPGGRTN